MTTNNTTFWELISSNKISIPIIQRDYAQGRETEGEKRDKFLDAIFLHLSTNKNLHLDFVYGRIKDKVFYPIDGQQRLTTLFLLHWYFALKEKEEISVDYKSKLSQFVYDTRISSREFCKSLVDEEFEIPSTINDDAFYTAIKDKYWYRDKWNSDPTVKAMLIMIQAIHNKFHHMDSLGVFNQLIKSKCISFESLDLGAKGFELTDELYIKMNSRGKQLTPFENFKANFIQLIDKNFKNKKLNHPIKGEISYSGYFSYRIEKEWTDLFWVFRGTKKTVDDAFYNYFEVITELLYFKKYKNAKVEDFKNNFSQYEDIYINKIVDVNNEEPEKFVPDDTNLLFLFNSLDKLHEINELNQNSNVSDFFNLINNNIAFFWNKSNEESIFEGIVFKGKSENGSNKIMFFTILHYLIKNNISNLNQGLFNYIRVIRNLLQSVRQRNETRYNTNVRINNFGNYWLVFEQLSDADVYKKIKEKSVINADSQISDASLKNEIDKAIILTKSNQNVNDALIALEELEEFGGLIHQLKPSLNENRLPEYLNAVKEIWSSSISDTLRIQALIACGFDGLEIKNINMGTTYYFGKKGNWTVILTSDEVGISDSVLCLLDKFVSLTEKDTEEKLKNIVGDWFISNKTDRNYRYYFLKYPAFTSKSNYYVWPNDYEISILGSEGSNPLLAFHISPYSLTVCKVVNDVNLCSESNCYLQYSGNAPLKLKNGIKMISKNEGWFIESNGMIDESLIEKYSLKRDADQFILADSLNKDRIEIAIEFINDTSKK